MKELFSAHLRELRARNDKSQKDMAQKIGISAAALSSYEKGQKTPPLDIAVGIARAYEVSLDWLCGTIDPSDSKHVDRYSDAIKTLFRLEASGLLTFTTDFHGEEVSLAPVGEVMTSFTRKWYSITQSYTSGVIDDELFSAWAEKQIRDNDKPVERAPSGDAL